MPMTRHFRLGMIVIVSLALLMEASRPLSGAVRLPWSITAIVAQVLDGVTIAVEYEGKREKVRYLGLHTPIIKHPTKGVEFYSKEAATANSWLVEGKTVQLEFDTPQRDRDGRLLAYVYVGDVMVNAELIRQGFAQVTSVSPHIKYQELFLTLEREAREAKRGLWGRPPIP